MIGLTPVSAAESVANDDFDDRISLPLGSAFYTTGERTTELGEVVCPPDMYQRTGSTIEWPFGDGTEWYEYTPATDGLLFIRTHVEASGFLVLSDYWTQIGIYTAPSAPQEPSAQTLTPVACSGTSYYREMDQWAEVRHGLEAGETYYIQVTANRDLVGVYATFTDTTPPVPAPDHDDLSNAKEVPLKWRASGLSRSLIGDASLSTQGATIQTDEPNTVAGTGSVWLRFELPNRAVGSLEVDVWSRGLFEEMNLYYAPPTAAEALGNQPTDGERMDSLVLLDGSRAFYDDTYGAWFTDTDTVVATPGTYYVQFLTDPSHNWPAHFDIDVFPVQHPAYPCPSFC